MYLLTAKNIRFIYFRKVIILAIVINFLFGSIFLHHASAQSVNVNAEVAYTINIKVYPEKRIPITGNWMNQNTIQIRNIGSSTPIITQVVNMNANGDGTMSSVSTVSLPPGNYDIAIKGYSHLRKVYSANLSSAVVNLNFTGSGFEMLAGDTSVFEDNYINSLDLSNISRQLYTSDLKNDLNRDTSVNALDLSNVSYNFYKSGDD